MRTVVATALLLLLALFLCPLFFYGDDYNPEQEVPLPTATLPIDRVPAPAAATSDAECTLRVKQGDGTVAEMSLSDYLWGVVAAEMPASFAEEALAAQAITARTYTLYQMSIGANQNHPDADMCTDINCCQAYLPLAQAAANWGAQAPAYVSKITSAVSAIDGQAILFDGVPIDAVFFSSAAGRTLDAVEVWGGSVPYLASVDSPEGEEVPNYRTTTAIATEDFRQLIATRYPTADLSGDPAGWFQNPVFTSSGGIATIDVGGVTAKGTALRTLCGLRSANFTVTADEQQVVFSVTGYGHGVGLSQYGANAMAAAGSSWSDIVTHYYTGVTVGPWP